MAVAVASCRIQNILHTESIEPDRQVRKKAVIRKKSKNEQTPNAVNTTTKKRKSVKKESDPVVKRPEGDQTIPEKVKKVSKATISTQLSPENKNIVKRASSSKGEQGTTRRKTASEPSVQERGRIQIQKKAEKVNESSVERQTKPRRVSKPSARKNAEILQETSRKISKPAKPLKKSFTNPTISSARGETACCRKSATTEKPKPTGTRKVSRKAGKIEEVPLEVGILIDDIPEVKIDGTFNHIKPGSIQKAIVTVPEFEKTTTTSRLPMDKMKSLLDHLKANHDPSGVLTDEMMQVLHDIVAEAELNKKLFSIFEHRRYIAHPLIEELQLRGWVQFQLDRESGVPNRRTKTDENPIYLNHTMLAWETNRSQKFHINPPAPTFIPLEMNQRIYDYGQRYQKKGSYKKKEDELFREYQRAINQIVQERNAKINFLWMSRKPDVALQYFSHCPDIGSKFQRTTFCSKHGLWHNLRDTNFSSHVDFPLQTPRMHNINTWANEFKFVFDFYMTAVVSLLRWFIHNASNEATLPLLLAGNGAGTISWRVIEFCITKAKYFGKHLNSLSAMPSQEIMGQEQAWSTFLSQYYKLINEGEKFVDPLPANFENLVLRAKHAVAEIRKSLPNLENDGFYNLWIIKPYSDACGRGIFMTNNLHYILKLSQKKYIIQKYIERPLLIAKTKFDIRQWFLLTGLRPLEIWIYKESYLRFCTVPFNTRNLHESVHLSNNAIQRKYTDDMSMSHQNMWDSHTFKRYLAEIGKDALWDELIFPGMRDAIICAMLSSQETFDKNEDHSRDEWFELYGADFMLSSRIVDGPWLIEINEGPALDPSSPITKRMVKEMLQDLVKVVIDRREDSGAYTGAWELAYRQQANT